MYENSKRVGMGVLLEIHVLDISEFCNGKSNDTKSEDIDKYS